MVFNYISLMKGNPRKWGYCTFININQGTLGRYLLYIIRFID